MADNVTVDNGGLTDYVVSSDEAVGGQQIQRIKLCYSADASETHIPADADGLLVNLGTNNDVSVTGTVTANLAAGSQNIGDVDVLTVPAPLSTTGAGTEAAALRVTIATDSTGVLSVDDNGSSLTVDGSVTANAGTNLNTSALALESGGNLAGVRTAVELIDDGVATVASAITSKGMAAVGTDGTNARILKTDTSGELQVDVLTVPAPLSTTGNGTAATAHRVTIASDSTGTVAVTQGTAASLNCTEASAAAIKTAVELLDDAVIADDATFTPGTTKLHMKGGYVVAHGSNPDAADAGDAGACLMNRHRVQWTIGGHPNVITRGVYISDATGAQTDATIVGTISAGTKVAVTMVAVTVDSATTATGGVAVKLGFGATTIPADSSTGAAGILLDHKGIAAGSGVVIGNGAGLIGIGADGEELRLTCEDPVGGGLSVTFSYYTIES